MQEVTRKDLVTWLRYLQQQDPKGPLPQIELSLGDHRVKWSDFRHCDNGGLPSIAQGHTADCRFVTEGNDGLHILFNHKEGWMRAHIDRICAHRNPIGHLVYETSFLSSAILSGLIVGVLARSWPMALLAGVAGGAIGAQILPPLIRTWHVRALYRDGRCRLVPVG